MAEETLLTAARRALRFFRIDEAKGGITTVDTLRAMETLDFQIRKEDERQKEAEAAAQAKARESADG